LGQNSLLPVQQLNIQEGLERRMAVSRRKSALRAWKGFLHHPLLGEEEGREERNSARDLGGEGKGGGCWDLNSGHSAI
jgi:hypothetical protein